MSSKKTALVCDDNATFAQIMQHLLTKQGFAVMTAHDGREGLQLLESAKPQLLLLDLHMEQGDGLSVLKALQGFKEKRPYTILVTGYEGKELSAQATELGANEVWRHHRSSRSSRVRHAAESWPELAA